VLNSTKKGQQMLLLQLMPFFRSSPSRFIVVPAWLKLKADVAVLGFEPPDPFGFGRLICAESGELLRIVEEKDATPAEQKLTLCNSGIILTKFGYLFDLLSRVGTKNAQNEYYLTDIIGIAVKDGLKVVATLGQPWQALTGVNTKEQLQKLEKWYKIKQA